MAVSLEARVPFLDYRVVEFSKKVSLNFKIRNSETKWLLRNILYKYIPKELFARPKSGFGIPVGDWLRKDLKDWAEDLLNEREMKKEGILNPVLIRKIWKEHLAGKGDWQYLLWDVLMFQAWKDRWM